MKGVIPRDVLTALVLASTVALAACAKPTPYQPATGGRGYAEQPLEKNRYRVTFSGNSITPRETVENYLLYRAAEVTLERGYDHFVVAEKDTERSTTYYSTSTGYGGYPTFYGFERGLGRGFGAFNSATIRPVDRYVAFANIVMRGGKKPSDDVDAYDARAVIDRLKPTIQRRPSS